MLRYIIPIQPLLCKYLSLVKPSTPPSFNIESVPPNLLRPFKGKLYQSTATLQCAVCTSCNSKHCWQSSGCSRRPGLRHTATNSVKDTTWSSVTCCVLLTQPLVCLFMLDQHVLLNDCCRKLFYSPCMVPFQAVQRRCPHQRRAACRWWTEPKRELIQPLGSPSRSRMLLLRT